MKIFYSVVSLWLILIVSGSVWAAQGAIPSKYHGMWAAGSCSSPKYYLHIEASGIQGYGSDKRSPLGNWDVRTTSKTNDGISFDVPETNSGKQFYMELAAIRKDGLNINIKSDSGNEQTEFERCS